MLPIRNYQSKYLKYQKRYGQLRAGASDTSTLPIPGFGLVQFEHLPRENSTVNRILQSTYQTPESQRSDQWRPTLLQTDLPKFVRNVRTETGMLMMLRALRYLAPPLTDTEFITVRDNLRYLYNHPCDGPCWTERERQLLQPPVPLATDRTASGRSLRQQQRLVLAEHQRRGQTGECPVCERWQRRVGDQVWTQEVAQEYGRLLRDRHGVNQVTQQHLAQLRLSPLQEAEQLQNQQQLAKQHQQQHVLHLEQLGQLREELATLQRLHRRHRNATDPRASDIRRAGDIKIIQQKIQKLRQLIQEYQAQHPQPVTTSEQLAHQMLLEQQLDTEREVTGRHTKASSTPITPDQVSQLQMEARGIDPELTFQSSEL